MWRVKEYNLKTEEVARKGVVGKIKVGLKLIDGKRCWDWGSEGDGQRCQDAAKV